MEKLTKQEIRGPDVFISNMERLGDWGYEYRKEVMATLTVVAVIALAWAGYGTYTSQKEDAAQEVLFHAEKTLTTTAQSFEIPTADAKGQPVKDGKAKAIATGNLDTDYKLAVEQLKDVIVRFPKTQSSVLAALDLGHLYYTHKMYDDGIAVLENSVKVVEHPITKAFVLLNLGLNQEAKGDCNGAIANWMKIPEDKAMGAFQGNALIKSALCYEKLNQNDKASEIYKRFDAAEKQRTQLIESLAAKHQVNLHIPIQLQPKDKIADFEKELSKSAEIQNIEALLSDRDAVKAAKRYLLLLKKGQS